MSVQRYGGLLMVLLLDGCSPTPNDAHLTVEYYRAHAVDRQRMVKECANDPGRSRESRACTNAREAERIEGVGSLRNLAPMGLPTNPDAKPNGTSPR
jgi:hypothetical protein